LLAVDDAHWADAPSLAFINYLAGRVESLPVAVVVSQRASEAGAEADLVRRIAAGAPERVLVLGPLSGEATAQLVRSLRGGAADKALCPACHAATGGNPFLVRELATALAAEGARAAGGAAARVGRLVPDAVARHVLVRLSGLGPAAAQV